MHDLIQDFGKEGKDEETGKPNGVFYVDRAAAKKVSTPFVKKAQKLSGPKLDEYMEREFEDLFVHFDVLSTGFIQVDQMGRFIKSLCKDQTLDIE